MKGKDGEGSITAEAVGERDSLSRVHGDGCGEVFTRWPLTDNMPTFWGKGLSICLHTAFCVQSALAMSPDISDRSESHKGRADLEGQRLTG